jgi:hypothetical protein
MVPFTFWFLKKNRREAIPPVKKMILDLFRPEKPGWTGAVLRMPT